MHLIGKADAINIGFPGVVQRYAFAYHHKTLRGAGSSTVVGESVPTVRRPSGCRFAKEGVVFCSPGKVMVKHLRGVELYFHQVVLVGTVVVATLRQGFRKCKLVEI